MNTKYYDVVILGGGLVGSLLAALLAKQNIKVLIVDTIEPKNQFNPHYDGRTTAVNYGTSRIFQSLGIWEVLENQSQPIHDIRVFEDGTAWTIDYNYRDLGSNPMGYIIENHHIRLAIHQKLEQLKVHWLITNLKPYETCYHSNYVELMFESIKYHASLFVGAEGRNSLSRSKTNIKTLSWDYAQKALVMHIEHDKPHNSTAWEIFTPQGPLAILPLKSCSTTGKNRSGIVWSASKTHPRFAKNDENLEEELYHLFPYYGSIRICSRRWQFPLTALKTETLIDHRYVLVGDAAHGMHPIAGQGVNVGWFDAKELSNVLGRAYSLGLDLGFEGTLKEYENIRLPQHHKMILATDKIHKLFMSPKKTLKFARNLGFSVVNHFKPVKKMLMKQAMGI